MGEPITAAIAFSSRVESLNTSNDARALVRMVRSKQFTGSVDPDGQAMASLISRARRLDPELVSWRWKLVIDLVREGVALNTKHLMSGLDLDNLRATEELLRAQLETVHQNGSGEAKTKVRKLLVQMADAAIIQGKLPEMALIESLATENGFDLYEENMGTFLCHLCGTLNVSDEDVELALAMLEEMARKSHFDINARHGGRSALFYARDGEIMRWLLEHGANPMEKGPTGHHVMMEAWNHGADDATFVALIEYGAELDSGPGWEEIQERLQDPASDNYPILVAAWKRKMLGDVGFVNRVGGAEKEGEDTQAM